MSSPDDWYKRMVRAEFDLAAAQATIEAVKDWRASWGNSRANFAASEIDEILSRADGSALEQAKASAFDEGAFAMNRAYVSDAHELHNPYRREGGEE